MSWLDKINDHLTIKTGDGEIYIPYWNNASKENEYNISTFEFPEVDGSLVRRGRVMGRKFSLELYFQADGRKGIDHIEESKAFEKSASDPRPWTIEHPFYGTLLVQPISLKFDNSDLNVTKITGMVIETISTTDPLIKEDAVDLILDAKENTEETYDISFVNDIPDPKTSDINKLLGNIERIYNEGEKRVKDTVDAQKYFNFFNTANALVAKATAGPLEAIRATRAMINAPFQFIDSVKNRVDMLVAQFNGLRSDITNLVKKNDIKIYENNGGIIVSTLVGASVFNQNNQLSPEEKTNFSYPTRVEVVETIENILDTYNTYIEDLDSFQSENYTSTDSYLPDADSLIKLSDLVAFTVANLFVIAASAKQERIIYLEDDTNLVMLAHRLYGLKSDDSTLQQVIDENNIGGNELLQIKKGRKIVWYV